ncbi:hypothetical protein ColTof3_06655 [Colletotrichum tofieldiae]|nr:hypothetical protein ColTof3_06655 [Colletotrichum tofieldiae]
MEERIEDDELVEQESRRGRARPRRDEVRARRAEGLWFSERRSSPKGDSEVFDSMVLPGTESKFEIRSQGRLRSAKR